MSPFSINTRDSFYSLSAISGGIGDAVRQQFGERPYWIVAEISELNVRKGHCYLSLVEKLPGSASPLCELKGIIWASKFEKIAAAFVSQTGVELTANTRILFQAFVRYDVKWGLSLVIEDIEPKYTAGLLQIERDRAVARLKSDGEYGLNKAVDFPLVPSRIAVISAKDSKGFEDFQNKLQSNPEQYQFQITLFSSLLQGEGAPSQITARLVEIFNDIHSYDVVVIVRGGGGTIDLNCFNDYKLSRAVARFPIPVITGIGHTTNISVVDEVAHADCITPTAAADFLIQKCREFEDYLMETMNGIVSNYDYAASEARSWLSEAAGTLMANAGSLLHAEKENVSAVSDNIARSAAFVIREQQSGLKLITSQLASLSGNAVALQKNFIDRELTGRLLKAPLQSLQHTGMFIERLEASSRLLDPASVLKRGFSITRINGKAIVDSKELQDGDEITTQFYEGTIQSKVISGGK